MQIPKANMVDVLAKAKEVFTLNKNKSVQVVAGYIQPIQDNRYKKEPQKINELYDLLQQFTVKTNSTVLSTNMHEFALFGTRELLDYITNHFREFPLLGEIKEILNIEAHIGFGLGLTAHQAEKHAKIALEVYHESDLGSCYIINDLKKKIGPIGFKKPIDTSRLYQAIIHKARLNNELSYHFLDFITSRNNEPFSSHDVALFYQVTKRSAERTINKLLAGEVIKTVGKERPYIKGRPRNLFQINDV